MTRGEIKRYNSITNIFFMLLFSQYENAKHQKYSKDELALKRKAAKPDLVTDSSQGCSKREDDNHANGMLSGRHHQAATLIQVSR